MGVLGFYLFYAALDVIPLVDAMLLRQSAPLTVPVVMWVWARDRIPPAAWYLALELYARAYSMAPARAIAPINYLAVVLAGLWGWAVWG